MSCWGLSSNDCVNSRATLCKMWHKSHWMKLWYPGIWSALILWIIPRWGPFIIFVRLLTRMEVTFPSEHLSVIHYCVCVCSFCARFPLEGRAFMRLSSVVLMHSLPTWLTPWMCVCSLLTHWCLCVSVSESILLLYELWHCLYCVRWQ